MVDLSPLRLAVAALDWRFAKTMPDAPHWYIVRGPDNEAIYAELFRAVKAHGVAAEYAPKRGRPYQQQYLDLGDGFKYWVMCAELRQSKIINRAHV